MAVTPRTIVGVNDGSDSFTNQSNRTATNNNTIRLKEASSSEVRPNSVTLAEMNELIPEVGEMVFETDNSVNKYWNGVEWKTISGANPIDETIDNRIVVNQINYLTTIGGVIDSTKQYLLDGIIDMGTTSITVPTTGMTIVGLSFDVSGLTSSEDNYTMFVSESIAIGSGNLLGVDYFIEVSGLNSKVYPKIVILSLLLISVKLFI